MKLIKFIVAPGQLTPTQVAPILGRELRRGTPDPAQWERLFDPGLDPRLVLEDIATEARSYHNHVFCDGTDATVACMTFDSGNSGWGVLVLRDRHNEQHEREWPTDENAPQFSYIHTVWLILQDDEQAERISQQLAQFDPEVSRFTGRRGH